MSDYSNSVTVNATPDQVFEFVSQVHNLPQYLPTIKSAEPQSSDRVKIQGEVRGHAYSPDGQFKADRANHSLQWGSDGEHQYHGSLEVKPASGNSSQVTVHISLTPKPEEAQRMQSGGQSVEQILKEGVDKALQSIKNIVEGKGGKVEVSQTTSEKTPPSPGQ